MNLTGFTDGQKAGLFSMGGKNTNLQGVMRKRGIGVGIASMISPMYIAEIAPANIRCKLVSWNQFAIIFGMKDI